MAPLDAKSYRNPEVPIRDKVAAWLLQQGATTVLLFAIAWGVYAKSEAILTRFESGYERNAVDLRKAAEMYEKTIDNAIQQWKDDRRILIEVLRRDHIDIPQSLVEPSGVNGSNLSSNQ